MCLSGLYPSCFSNQNHVCQKIFRLRYLGIDIFNVHPVNKLTNLTNHLHGAETFKPSYSDSEKFCPFYGTQRFITIFTGAYHLSLSWATLLQYLPSQCISLRSSLIFLFHLCPSLASGIFPSVSHQIPVFISLSFYATCPTYFILLDYIIWIISGVDYTSLCIFVKPPITSSAPYSEQQPMVVFSQTCVNFRLFRWAS